MTATEWRWGCLRCLLTGAADGAANARALLAFHEMYACPATAGNRDEYERRVAWRATLARRYGVPAWAGGWRGGGSNPSAEGATR